MDTVLDNIVRQVDSQALAPRTKRTYKSAFTQWLRFRKIQRKPRFLQPPEEEALQDLKRFLAYLQLSRSSPRRLGSSCKVYLASVRKTHIDNDQFFPASTNRLKPTLQAILRSSESTRMQPLTAAALRSFYSRNQHSISSSIHSRALWTALLFIWNLPLRVSEVLPRDTQSRHISPANVFLYWDDNRTQPTRLCDYPTATSCPPNRVSVLIPFSKTDQSGQGYTVGAHSSKSKLCCVQALYEYWVSCSRPLDPAKPIFPISPSELGLR